MKQKAGLFFILFIFLFAFFSCVDDDVCDKATTPRITFRFKDATHNNDIKVDGLFVERINPDGTVSYEGKFIKVDSISVPMNPLSDRTVFRLYNDSLISDLDKDIITVEYQTQQEFVSKACGLRVVYNQVNYELTQAKEIKTIIPITTEIKNESKNLFIIY